MNWLPLTLLFVAEWLLVFAGTQFPVLRDGLATPLNLVPALVAYAALQHPLPVVTAVAVTGGLGLDALSGTPLGVSVAPLFAAGFVIHTRQHLLLRRHTYAQFWLGLFAGVGITVATGLLLRLGDRPPALTAGTLWQVAVLGLANGLACPALHLLLGRLRRALEYQPVTVRPDSPDRQIKRGRT